MTDRYEQQQITAYLAKSRKHGLLTAERERELGGVLTGDTNLGLMFGVEPGVVLAESYLRQVAERDGRARRIREGLGAYSPTAPLGERRKAVEDLVTAVHGRRYLAVVGAELGEPPVWAQAYDPIAKGRKKLAEGKDVPKTAVLGFTEQDAAYLGINLDEDARRAHEPYRGVRRAYLTVQGRAGEAQEQFVLANARRVVKRTKRFKHRPGVSEWDLIQEGNLGLLRATAKFDHEKGFRFGTYATWWIHQRMLRYCQEKLRDVRVPVHAQETRRQYEELWRQAEQEEGRTIGLDEFLRMIGVSTKERKKVVTVLTERSHISLDQKIDESSPRSATIGDRLTYDDQVDADESYRASSLHDKMATAMELLTERERRVLELRYGFDGQGGKSLEVVGKAFELTRERIRQIEAKALRKLRGIKGRQLLEGF